MKFHEAGPGFIKENVIAERTDTRENAPGVVDRAVIGALLDDGGAERPFALPGVFVFYQWIGADRFAQSSLVERLRRDRADQAR